MLNMIFWIFLRRFSRDFRKSLGNFTKVKLRLNVRKKGACKRMVENWKCFCRKWMSCMVNGKYLRIKELKKKFISTKCKN